MTRLEALQDLLAKVEKAVNPPDPESHPRTALLAADLKVLIAKGQAKEKNNAE